MLVAKHRISNGDGGKGTEVVSGSAGKGGMKCKGILWRRPKCGGGKRGEDNEEVNIEHTFSDSCCVSACNGPTKNILMNVIICQLVSKVKEVT